MDQERKQTNEALQAKLAAQQNKNAAQQKETAVEMAKRAAEENKDRRDVDVAAPEDSWAAGAA